jgi:hypothetical protein
MRNWWPGDLPPAIMLEKDMRPSMAKVLGVLVAGSGAMIAQGIQNSDFAFMAGRSVGASQTVPGSGVKVSTSGGYVQQTSYGYQLLSLPGGSLWLDVPFTFVFRDAKLAGTNQGADRTSSSILVTPGLRFQVTPHRRVALYGVGGFGFGGFDYVKLLPASSTKALGYDNTDHGVFEFGGGIDFRVNHSFSLRGEVRDFVTGRNLGGVAGPNHPVYLFGVALHY